MEISPPLIAHHQSAEAIEPSQRPFDHPAVPTEPLARLNSAASDPREDAACPADSAIARVVVALADCVDWLRVGGSLYFSPEGRLSPDVRLRPFRAGPIRSLRAAPSDTCVQPIAIVYDYMTVGRTRMWIDLAPAIEDGALLTRTELEAGVAAWARELFAAGRQIDPVLLTEEVAHRRVADYLTYADLHRTVRQYGSSVVLVAGEPAALNVNVTPGDGGYRYAPLTYAANEAREMVASLPARDDMLAM